MTDSQNIEVREPEPAFTVSNSGKKVRFAKGNLYWDGTQFKFEESQYEFPTTWSPSHVGHFWWHNESSVAIAEEYDETARERMDGKFFAADGGAIAGWTVLSADEWQYVFDNSARKNSTGGYYICINEINCLVLMPDGFNGTIADSYTVSEWAEAEKFGLIALPTAGERYSDKTFYSNSRQYWTNTIYSGEKAKYADFGQTYASISTTLFNSGYSVRLVQVVE